MKMTPSSHRNRMHRSYPIQKDGGSLSFISSFRRALIFVGALVVVVRTNTNTNTNTNTTPTSTSTSPAGRPSSSTTTLVVTGFLLREGTRRPAPCLTKNSSHDRRRPHHPPHLFLDRAGLNKSSRLVASSSKNNNDEEKKNADETASLSTTITNPFDQVLTLISSDYFSIGLGLVGLLVVVGYRWNLILSMDSINNLGSSSNSIDTVRQEATQITYQTRSDLLAVFACGSVLLNGVTKLDVTTALAESVTLIGEAVLPQREDAAENAAAAASSKLSSTVAWALQAVLRATPAKTAVILIPASDTNNKNKNKNNASSSSWTIYARAGIVPAATAAASNNNDAQTRAIATAPILDRVGSPNNMNESYLPTLQALPGRTEFLAYLPSNTQVALLLPIIPNIPDNNTQDTRNNVLVLGGNTAKSFTPRDIAWCRIIAERIGPYL